MSESYVVDDDYYMTPAFAGLLADLQFTSKESHPTSTVIPFGVVATPVVATGVLAVGGTGVGGGVALHDHIRAAVNNANQYKVGDAVSLIRRGRVWCRASGTCTKGAAAKFNAITGVFGDAEANTLTNARFRTANVAMDDGTGAGTTVSLVLVELHDPAIDAV